jgi:NAD(P)-dependent dehydrogenase (short-subunit alcohol dehydrogenase family)
MAERPLAGRVAVVPVGDSTSPSGRDLAERLATAGATVVLVTEEGGSDAAGRLAADIEASGAGRAAVFTGSDLDALVELLGELFR